MAAYEDVALGSGCNRGSQLGTALVLQGLIGVPGIAAVPRHHAGHSGEDHHFVQHRRRFLNRVDSAGAGAETFGVEFLCYHRDRVGSGPLRDALLERHGSYMDRYAQQMIARGPTLTPDGEHATGSIHALDLPDHAAARAFALEEPYYRAGIGSESDQPVALPHDTSDVIAYGPLLTDDAATTLGTAALVRATGAETARDVLGPRAWWTRESWARAIRALMLRKP